jgi:glutamine synthetase
VAQSDKNRTESSVTPEDVVGIVVVDNAGISRLKGVPGERWEAATRGAVGLSPSIALFAASGAFGVRDGVTTAVGDIRLLPDVDRLQQLPSTPGWWWVPADMIEQDGTPFGGCSRSFLRRMIEAADTAGIDFRMAFEHEWSVGRTEPVTSQWVPSHTGPGFGADQPFVVLDMLRGVANDLRLVGCTPGQVHAEWSHGQLEASLPARDPLRAADDALLARTIIKRRAELGGFQASFAPMSDLKQLGNGAHAHFSLHNAGGSLMAGGEGPHGFHKVTEQFIAGVLDHLPALTVLGSPTPLSYVRLAPWGWSGTYACWGAENRQAALRIEGLGGDNAARTANVEWKAVDASANPYQVLGGVIAAGLDGVRRSLTLPPETLIDPSALTDEAREEAGLRRLPGTIEEALAAFEGDEALRDGMGTALHESIVAVRRAEAESTKDLEPQQLLDLYRNTH